MDRDGDLDEAIEPSGTCRCRPTSTVRTTAADASAIRRSTRATPWLDRGADGRPALHAGLLERLDAAGVERLAVTLHVGYGTFKPVRVDEVEDHMVDPERYAIDEAAAAADQCGARRGRRRRRRRHDHGARARIARRRRRPIVAGDGTTTLFIHPGSIGFASSTR